MKLLHNMIRKISTSINHSKFVKDIFTLLTGTTIAQALPIILMPVVSRLYSPDDFAILAFFLSSVAILSSGISLKYELSIILPKKNEDASYLLLLSISLSIIFSVLFLLAITIFNERLTLFIDKEQNEIAYWLYFIPLASLLLGINNSFAHWYIRKSLFKQFATSKVLQTSSMTFTQITLGLLKFTPKGLLFAELFGRFAATFFFTVKLITKKSLYRRNIKFNIIKKLFIRYKDFPRFSLPASFLNVVTNQAPVFIIGSYFGGFALGNYALMERALAVPIALIGQSILDVFKQKAMSDYHENGNCINIYKKTFKSLLFISIIPALVLFFFAPILFEYIFGENWKLAGDYAQIMSVLFIFRFTASPLGFVLYITEKQKIEMVWQFFLLLMTILSFGIGIFFNNLKYGLISFSISYSIMYCIYLILSYNFAKGKTK